MEKIAGGNFGTEDLHCRAAIDNQYKAKNPRGRTAGLKQAEHLPVSFLHVVI